MTRIQIRQAKPLDVAQVAQILAALWPEASAEEHGKEIAPVLEGKAIGTMPAVLFVAETAENVLAGFLEAGLRSHADGCDTRQPVGFIEVGLCWRRIESRA